MTNKSTN